MKSLSLITALIAIISNAGFGEPTQYKHTDNPDAQWYGNAGLGLFIHWGLSSVNGEIELSWGMMADVPWASSSKDWITPNEYFKLADKFNPDKYDPDKWIKAAKEMGCTYAVLTTKHHEGYAMWPSSYGDFGTRDYMGGRDLVQPFVDACRKYGVKVGFYYSPPDWYFNRNCMSFRYYGKKDGVYYGLNHEPIPEPVKPPHWDAKYTAYLRGQIRELLTRYGKVDLLWFDGGPDVISIDEIHKLQPGIVINDRMHGYGDFATPEYEMPKTRPGTDWWENCASWISGWGYRKSENYNSAGWMLSRLVQVRAWGGNLLINVAPRPNGELPDVCYSRMKEVSEWMKHSGVSVVGTSAGPWPEKSNVPVTVKDGTWYLHALPDFKDDIVVKDVPQPVSVRLLRTDQNILYTYSDKTLRVKIPDFARTKLVDVVEVKWK